MAAILNSLKKLAAFIILITFLAMVTVFVFELVLIGPPSMPTRGQILETIIVFAFGLPVIYLLGRIKVLLTPRIGLQTATILQILSQGLAGLFLAFIILDIFEVGVSTLLTSAGIISVTVGLIISTFVGGLLSGALVFTTHKIKIGEDVMVNNMPGKVTDMTALVLRIRTDVGQITIPNSAVASGGVIITSVRSPEEICQETRLPYVVGDRVVTSYRNEEGIVKEITGFHTTVLLDSGKEIIFLNNSVLIGAVPIAKITQKLTSD